MTTATSLHELGAGLAEEVGMMQRVWQQAEGQPELQAQVAAIALAYFCRETPAWLELIWADTELAYGFNQRYEED